jgi:hypothetical protein
MVKFSKITKKSLETWESASKVKLVINKNIVYSKGIKKVINNYLRD